MSLWLQEVWLRRGAWAVALLPLSLVYAGLVALRTLAYRLRWVRTTALPVPVVVVGNLVAGGAGKTPTVMAIVAAQRARGFRPGIVSRGHGRNGSALVDVRPDTPVADCGDEPLLLRLRTGAPVLVGSDRVAAARALLRLHPEVDLVVSDDGLQHLRLARQAQVLVFDERGAGNGWLLPAGPLREAMPARVPTRSVVLYNAPTPSTALPGHLAHRALAGAASLRDWSRGDAASLDVLRSLRDRPVLAAAAVARPERFFASLEAEGLSIVRLPLPDHWRFETLPWPADCADVIVTEKDAVKLSARTSGATRVWVATLDFVPHAGFDAALAALLPAPPSPPRQPSGIGHGNSLA
ncbi:MAG: tetraacyldisaccharide 4'-kinase [Burkholderiaceae bacterium]